MTTAVKEKKFTSPKEMLNWQYQEIIWELGEISRHMADPNCPCNLADKGEFCGPKHCLALHGLARETIPMDDDSGHKEILAQLQAEAWDKHVALKDRIVCEKDHKDEGDVVSWARQWRKRIEDIYYHGSCKVDLRQNVPSSQWLGDIIPLKFAPTELHQDVELNQDKTVCGALRTSLTEERQAGNDYRAVAFAAREEDMTEVASTLNGIAKQEDSHYHKIEKLVDAHCPESEDGDFDNKKLPKCTVKQAERRESCILDVKASNTDKGCRIDGRATRMCPNPFAVCNSSIGCRIGKAS